METHTVVVIVHLVGVAAGIGTATLLDIMTFRRFLRGPLTESHLEILETGGRLVTAAVACLWFSGAVLVVLSYASDPAILVNPKVWAKLTIVCLLTLNGFLIHGVVLPAVRANVGFPLLHNISGPKLGLFLLSGATSGVSWFAALVLGAARELDFAVPASQIIAAYILVLAASVLLAHTLLRRRTSNGSRAHPGTGTFYEPPGLGSA